VKSRIVEVVGEKSSGLCSRRAKVMQEMSMSDDGMIQYIHLFAMQLSGRATFLL
jgi:hypothetical protein